MKNIKSIVFSWLSFAALVVAIVLEALPYGAALIFVTNPEKGETVTELYSYFSFTPFGYANFAPLVTAALTVMLTIAALVLQFIKHKNDKIDAAFLAVVIVAVIISVCPIFQGLECYTMVGIFISLMLVASAIFFTLSKMFRSETDDKR